MNTHRPRQSAFTLIELLIVVSIISLLAAILFPVFARARESARRSACLSNMKQIGLGLMQYAQDYDETLPISAFTTTMRYMDTDPGVGTGYSPGAEQNWLRVLLPYTKSTQIYVCPSAGPIANPVPCGVGFAACTETTTLSKSSYYGNGVVIPNMRDGSGNPISTAKARRLASIADTAAIVYSQERNVHGNFCATLPRQETTTSYVQWHNYNATTQVEILSSLHFEGGNLLFCDGHAKWRRFMSLRSGEFGLSPDQSWSTTNQSDPDGALSTFTSALP